jgi:hypothetical protein
MVLLFGCAPKATSLADLGVDAEAALKDLPGVVSVSRQLTSAPVVRRVIQIDDWHYVPREAFAVDLRTSDPDVTHAAIDEAYETHMADVKAVQAEQVELLRSLALLGGGEVFIEGLTAEDMSVLDSLTSEESRLALGAAGQLHHAGVLELLPAESEASHALANPIADDGSIDLSKAAGQLRHADIAKQLATRKPLAVIILGAWHDLGDTLPPATEYLRVRTKRVAELMEE